MHRFFYVIHSFIEKRKFVAILVFVGMLLGFMYCSSKIKFTEDVTKLIPTHENTDVTARVINQLNFADKITVVIRLEKDGTTDDLTAYAQAFLKCVSEECEPYIDAIQGKVNEDAMQETMDFVYQNLPLFLDDKDYMALQKKLEKDSIAHIVANNLKAIVSPTGIVTKDFIFRDPLGISFLGLKKWQQLTIVDDFQLEHGFVMTKDKKRVLLFITPRLPANETDKNAVFMAHLNRIKEKLNQQFSSKVQARYFGATPIAVANANQIKSDIILTTTVAMTLLMGLLILFYRQPVIPFIIFIPTVFGGFFAAALLFVLKDTVSTISFGIGAILLGITIDYSLHILTHYKHNSDVKTLYKDITMPLIMSSTTTAVAFLCLLLVKSEALQDLGIFAATVVVASAVFSLLIIPHLYKPKSDSGHKKNSIDVLAHISFHKNKVLIAGCLIIIGICFFTQSKVRFNDDLSQLNFVPKDIKEAEKDLEESTNMTSKSIYLVSYGTTREEVLQNNSELFFHLSQEKENHEILGFSSIGGVVLSEKEQQRKIDRWYSFWNHGKKAFLLSGLVSEGVKVGFKPTAYHAFFEGLDKKFNPISFEDYAKPKVLPLQEFATAKNGFFTISSLVKVTPEQRDVFVKKVTEFSHLVVIDRKQMSETFLGKLKTDFNTLVNYSFIAVVLILYFFFRRIELVIISCIPILITGVVTAGIMGLFGSSFTIFSTIVCTLIFGHGVDFSIFMTSALQKEYTTGKNEMPIYRTSILLAVITSILGIGALIFARHPTLRSISSVSLIGIFAALIITFIFYPLLFKAVLSNRPKKGKAPIEIRRVLHSGLSFLYYGLGSFLLSVGSLMIMKLLPLSGAKKEKAFHYLMSKFMKSVLMTYPSVKRKVINTFNENFDRPAVIIANHSSFLDILAIGMLSPKIIFLVNDWVYHSPVFGKGVRLAGFYPVSHGINQAAEHLRDKIEKGYSLMVFPEGTRSETNVIQRFHKGAFFLAEHFQLDIIPIVIHGYSEVLPKGDFMINGGHTTLTILDRIPPTDDSFGTHYAERTKKISIFFKAKYSVIRQELEGVDYFKKMLLTSFDYKDFDTVKAVKKNLNQHLESYYELHQEISANASILHLADDYGQLDILLALQEPQRKIIALILDEEKRGVAKTNYITKKRKITYIETKEEVTTTTYDVVLISDTTHPYNADEIGKLANQVILIGAFDLKTELLRLGFKIDKENKQHVILKKT